MPIAAGAICFLVPLILTPRLLFYYDITPKVMVILLGAAALLVLASFNFDSLRRFAGTREGRWYVAAAASIGAAILTSITAQYPGLAWNGSNWRRYGALTQCAVILAAWLIAAGSATPGIRPILRAICAGGLIASLYGIAQFFGWDPILAPAGYEAGEGVFQIVRPPGTMGHADYLGAFLL
jgi:hypothetical protein